MVHLRLANEQDLNLIAELAKVIWNDHYVSIIGQEQVDYMLNTIYNLNSLKNQLHEKKHHFYLIENSNQTTGFLSVSSENKQDYFLHKFYIDQKQANTGLGTETLNLLIEIIKPKTMMLTVNRQNFKSINFYFKNGFKIDHVADFDIGNDYQMNDFVMKRTF